MSDTIPALRDRLADRAAATPLEVAAARARLEGRLVRADRPVRHRRRTLALAVAVAAVLIGVVGAAVVAVVHEHPTTGPAAAGGQLPLSDWLFTVDAAALPTALSVVEYVRADRSRQTAAVLSPGDAATSNHFSALVELAADPSELGVATRPAGAVDVDGTDAWTSAHPDDEYGVSGVQLVWTDPTGYTGRVIAPDAATARHVYAATTVGEVHPVLFPATFAAGWFPPGSRLRSYDFVGTQGASVVVDVPGAPALQIDVAASGTYVSPELGDVTTPFAAGFSLVTNPDNPHVSKVTSASGDLGVNSADPTTPGDPVSTARLRALLQDARFASFTDPTSWFPLRDAVPTG